MFGCHTLAVRLLAWETLFPKLGALPQIAHFAMASSVIGNHTFYHGSRENTIPSLLRTTAAQGRIPPPGPFPAAPPHSPSGDPPPDLAAGSRSPGAPRRRD